MAYIAGMPSTAKSKTYFFCKIGIVHFRGILLYAYFRCFSFNKERLGVLTANDTSIYKALLKSIYVVICMDLDDC